MQFDFRTHSRNTLPWALTKFLREVPLAGTPQLLQSIPTATSPPGGIPITSHRTSLGQRWGREMKWKLWASACAPKPFNLSTVSPNEKSEVLRGIITNKFILIECQTLTLVKQPPLAHIFYSVPNSFDRYQRPPYSLLIHVLTTRTLLSIIGLATE